MMTEAIHDPTVSEKMPWNVMPCVLRFRDLKDEYDALECVVLGVSADHEVSHGKFIAKFGLNFSLLADTDRYEVPQNTDLFRCREYTRTPYFLPKSCNFGESCRT